MSNHKFDIDIEKEEGISFYFFSFELKIHFKQNKKQTNNQTN